MVSSSFLSLALVALMASQESYGFQASPTFSIKSKTSSGASSQLLMSSKAYEEQLKRYYNTAEPPQELYNGAVNGDAPSATTSTSVSTDPAPVYGAPQQMPPPPQSFQPAPVQPAPVVQQQQGPGGLGNAAVVFLGLPLWLLLSTQVFFNKPAENVAPTTVTSSTPVTVVEKLALPIQATTNNGAPAGVVVLSQPITKQEVRNLFNLWNDALKTGDPATVAKRYGKDGVLLPTLSDIPRNDFEGIKDYFVGFLKKHPTGKILEGEIFIGNNWAQDAGIYEFTFDDGSKVKARYSFVYAFEDGKWMISHHHSSLMPQETVRPVKVTEEEVRSFFGLWNDALKTGDPQKVADRYSKDAVLLPTLSDEARYTNDRIADYFVGFLKKKPTGEILEGNIKIGPNWAQDAGIYEFTFEDGSKTRGRYSYVYTYENGEWKISNHHSSIMPQPAVAAMKKAVEYEKSQAEAVKMINDMDKKMTEMDARVAEMNGKLSIAILEKAASNPTPVVNNDVVSPVAVSAVSGPALVEALNSASNAI